MTKEKNTAGLCFSQPYFLMRTIQLDRLGSSTIKNSFPTISSSNKHPPFLVHMQMSMIVHEAVCSYLDSVLLVVFPEQGVVLSKIVIFFKNRLLFITPLCYLMK